MKATRIAAGLILALTGEKTEPDYKEWYGTLQTPLLKVDWK